MAKQVINNIGINDDLPSVIRKVNDNFRRVVTQQQQRIRSTVETTVNNTVGGGDAIGAIQSALQNALSELDAYQKETEASFKETIDAALAQAEDDLRQSLDALLAEYQIPDLLENISSLVYGASVVDNKIELPEGMLIPTGNINVYALKDEELGHFIATHKPNEDPELDFDVKA